MARTTNEFGGGEIVPAIEAITGIQAPVMADFVIVPDATVIREDGSARRIQDLENNLKSSSGIERIPFNSLDELDTEQGAGTVNAIGALIFFGTPVTTLNTVTGTLTNANGTVSYSLTFTPAEATLEAFTTGFATAWNASSNARLSEYTATGSGNALIITADASGSAFNISVFNYSTGNGVTSREGRVNTQTNDGKVVHALNTGDSRIRFVGSGWNTNSGFGGGDEGTVTRTTTEGDYAEITFFGTGFNVLTWVDNTERAWFASVDGGVPRMIYPVASTLSAVLINQNTDMNVILPVASNLSPGVHTVKITRGVGQGGTEGLTLFGCEIINSNAGITQQPGADFDGRVEALSGTTFPIKPDNVTVPSADRAGNAAAYTNSAGLSGIQGARVLNYLTSGGQYKQVFNTADAAISAGPGNSSERTASIYTLQIDGPGSGTGTITSTIAIPQESTTLSLETFGAGGDGGNGTVSGGANLSASGGGGGGGAYANASYTKTAAIGDTLTIVAGAGSETGNVNNTTITGGGALSGNFTVNSGMMGGTGDAAAGTPGAAGIAGTIPTSATITGLTITGTPTFGAGNNGTIGEAKSGIGDGNVEGGNGGLPGNQPGAGQTDNGGSGFNTVMPGEIPGGGGGGGGATFTSDFVGAQGGNGRVTITIRARAGLSEVQFGSNVSIVGTPVTDGTIFAPSSDLLGTPENVFASASHGNQEVIRRINFREFGANSEFATLTGTPSARAFTLDDGTTTLVGGSRVHTAIFNGVDYLSIGALTASPFTGQDITITFVGTGLDVFYIVGGADAVRSVVNVSVDGFSIGNYDAGDNFFGIRPIVSGLSYGTHTVRFETPAGNDNDQGISDFIIYGPKKPEIPTLDAGSLELSDYNIMADYSANDTRSSLIVSKGVLGKAFRREFLYTGTVGPDNPVDTTRGDYFGGQLNASSGSTYSYTGYIQDAFEILERGGSGADTIICNLDNNVISSTNFDISVDGGTRTGTGALQNLDITTVDGSYAPGTGTWTSGSNFGGRLIFEAPSGSTAIPLGVHTIRFDHNSTTAGGPSGVFFHTPIHINDDNLKVGSEGLNNLTIDPIVEEDEAVVQANLGEAKAWLSFNTTNLGTGNAGPNSTILSSYNIAAVLQSPAGSTSVIQVYFDKPFKGNTYVVSGLPEHTNGSAGSIAVDRRTPATNVIAKTGGSVQLISSINNTVFDAVFHGELIDE